MGSENSAKMSLVTPDKFQHILRLMNTNIDGRRKVMFAMTAIKGVGRRYSNIVLKKADIDMSKRAGELSEDEVERIITIISNPRQYKIPDWFLNRQKDIKDGKTSQVLSNFLDNKLREDLERLKKIRPPRSTPLLGRPRPRSAHQDHRQEGSNRRRLQEEVNSQNFFCCRYPLSPSKIHARYMRTWSVSRRSGPTAVYATTGESASAVSPPRPRAGGVALSVSPRRSKLSKLFLLSLSSFTK